MATRATPHRNIPLLKDHLRIAIVGCGLCGLAAAITLRDAGHSVMIVERMPELREDTGAGIQLPPNATRLLHQWGLLDLVRKHGFQPETGTLRSYRGQILSQAPPGSIIERLYQAPYLVIHRADLLKILRDAAMERDSIEIRLGSEVTNVDFDRPSLTLADGETICADVLIGADGERSFCRNALLEQRNLPSVAGDVAYRIAVQREDIVDDASNPARELVQKSSVNLWLGPDAHGVSYLLRDQVLNVVIIRASTTTIPETLYGAQPADVEELRDYCKDWDPVLQELLRVRQPDCTKWSLLQIDDLESWRKGCSVLIGDAAHAVLPYLAQGAAQAFEDAAVLAATLGQVTYRSEILDALAVFERIRKPRTAEVRRRTLAQKAMYGMKDGPQQEERDKAFLASSGRPAPGSPNVLADPNFQKWLWGYEATADGRAAWTTFQGEVKSRP